MTTYLEQLLGRYLSIRARSEVEVRRYLVQKRRKILVSDELVENLITKYKDLGYIDDEKFAEAVSHSVIANKFKGSKVLEMKLKMAGVDPAIIKRTLAATDPEEIHQAMEKRLSKYEQKWHDLPAWERQQKMYAKLISSGFSSSEIGRFLDERSQKR